MAGDTGEHVDGFRASELLFFQSLKAQMESTDAAFKDWARRK